MPDETKVTTDSNGELIARLGAQRSKFRAAAQSLAQERDQARADLTKLRERLAELEKTADTSAAVKRVAELERQIRERDHRSVFDRLAKTKGVAEDSLDLVYQLSGYQAEADQADEAAIGTLLDEAKGRPGLSRLFGPGDPAKPAPIVKPAPGGGQGGNPAEASPHVMQPGDPRISDVKYQFMNFDSIARAAQERIARGEV
jgi:regulator of replication initiation timing